MSIPVSLATVAAGQGGVLTRKQARECGCTESEVGRWVDGGVLRPLWRGILTLNEDPGDPTARHRERAVAIAAVYDGRLVVSHHSALVVAGLPTYGVDLAVVRLVRRNKGDSLSSGGVRISRCTVDPPARTIDGVRVVADAIAVAQVAAEAGVDAAVVSGDAALHRESATTQEMQAAARLLGLLRKARRVTQAIDLLDGRSESPGESLLRLIAVRGGLELEPQFVVRDDRGHFVARCDFRLSGSRVLVEFDGAVKYDAPAALFAEKKREDRLRALGWRVVRVVWADLQEPGKCVARIRAAATGGPPTGEAGKPRRGGD